MKALRLQLFQETACYKKPHALKVSETYPLPPYSTVIGMIHNLLQVSPGELLPMKVCVQGDCETMFTDYQTHYFYKSDKMEILPLNFDGLGLQQKEDSFSSVTTMPIYRHLLYNIYLYIYISAEDEILEQIFCAFQKNTASLSLGRAEDLVRIDECRIVVLEEDEVELTHSAYVPNEFFIPCSHRHIPYKINSVYRIKEGIRVWDKILVGYIKKETALTLDAYKDILDEEGNCNAVFFYGE